MLPHGMWRCRPRTKRGSKQSWGLKILFFSRALGAEFRCLLLKGGCACLQRETDMNQRRMCGVVLALVVAGVMGWPEPPVFAQSGQKTMG